MNGTLITQARQARWEGRLPDAKRLYSEALSLAVTPSERALALTGVGQIERDMGNLAVARDLYSEAVLLLREQSDPLMLAHTIRHVADMDRVGGDFPRAEPAYQEALTLYRNSPHTPPLDLANTLNGVSKLFAVMNQRGEAIALATEARDIYALLEVEPGVIDCNERLQSLSRTAERSTGPWPGK